MDSDKELHKMIFVHFCEHLQCFSVDAILILCVKYIGLIKFTQSLTLNVEFVYLIR